MAAALVWNVLGLAERYGLERLGFLTLTFADHVTDAREAQRRLHSLVTHVLSVRYWAWVRVLERQVSGRIHYHLLVVLGSDIRAGVDFAALERCDYRSAGSELRAEWAFWRRTAKAYGFGRTELLPVRRGIGDMAAYVGKYIAKHVEVRDESDKGVRLVEYSRSARVARSRFSWADGAGRQWRAGVGELVDAMAANYGVSRAMARSLGPAHLLGSRWSYDWRDRIMELGAEALRAATQAASGSEAREQA